MPEKSGSILTHRANCAAPVIETRPRGGHKCKTCGSTSPAPAAEVRRLYRAAVEAALAEVERRARLVLKRRPDLAEFVMAMGVWSFTGHDGRTVEAYKEHRGSGGAYRYEPYQWARPLADFIGEWDDYLKLTGSPMRFTADGPVVTSW